MRITRLDVSDAERLSALASRNYVRRPAVRAFYERHGYRVCGRDTLDRPLALPDRAEMVVPWRPLSPPTER